MGTAHPTTTLDVDGSAPQARLSVLLRCFYAIPHSIVSSVLEIAAGAILVVSWFVILFTGKLPAGMANFMAGALHWQLRVMGYQYLLTDKYPPFALGEDNAYPIRAGIVPLLEERNRITCFFRPILLIPHVIALAVLGIAVVVVLVISWFAALFTGAVPASMHTFMAGFLRWFARAGAYGMLLTDEYPPLSLS